jgi:WhiB family transcriptional regulator, redox-sensing transcriptional regulator
MRQRGTPVAVIAAHLHVDVRSVGRYLAAPCPQGPPAEPKPDLSFRMHGACGNRMDVDWFSGNQAKIADAKAVCAQCPVLALCRDYGLTAGRHEWGIWGGLTEDERRSRRQGAA